MHDSGWHTDRFRRTVVQTLSSEAPAERGGGGHTLFWRLLDATLRNSPQNLWKTHGTTRQEPRDPGGRPDCAGNGQPKPLPRFSKDFLSLHLIIEIPGSRPVGSAQQGAVVS